MWPAVRTDHLGLFVVYILLYEPCICIPLSLWPILIQLATFVEGKLDIGIINRVGFILQSIVLGQDTYYKQA